MTAPLVLEPDNFTPPTRTPWGGTKIRSLYKQGLVLTAGDIVGESWEISVEPSFPSVVADSGTTLRDVIAAAPEHWLGPELTRAAGGQTPLLVKLLDTNDNLSVQVHPAMDDPALKIDESGKPESWIVLGAQPGAGVYLGLRDGVSRQMVEHCLNLEGPLNDLLNFVPCTAGDAFLIRPGTVHAIGAGMTILEPQHVAPAKRGLTYRFWDWNRRYDEHGKLSPTGKPRQLHVQRSLEVSTFDATGADFVDSCRATGRLLADGALKHHHVLTSPYFETESLTGTGAVRLPTGNTMVGITFAGGTGAVETHGGTVAMQCGQSAVIPAAANNVRVELEQGICYLSRSRVA